MCGTFHEGVGVTFPLILERDSQLVDLTAALEQASDAGGGSVALICGESGIGKTTLVELFAKQARTADVKVLRGACDALRTPRPLGPLLDIARGAGGHLQAIAEGEPKRERLFATFLELLERQRPSVVVVIEDVHWADFATLDLLTFLGRRIRDTRALLIVTFRDDEMGPRHPLRDALATLPRDVVRRLPLPRLSREAVAELARLAGRSPGDLYDLTSGNPFYLSEVLASDGNSVPPSVQDAVFARARALDALAKQVLDVVALAPGFTERWLLDAVLDPRPEDVQAGVAAGLLVESKGSLAFRHEVARQAWTGIVETRRAGDLHARLLAALEAAGVAGGATPDAARLVHHAIGAGDRASVLRLAPRAAAEAARLGAHREAVAHYTAAIEAAGNRAPAELADLLEGLARESFLTGADDRALDALQEALTIRYELGDRHGQCEDERGLARLAWYRGDEPAVRVHVAAAIEAAEPLGPSAELARAYGTRSQYLMNAESNREAVAWGERALDMARAVDDVETIAHTLVDIGSAKLKLGESSGRDLLAEALALSRGKQIRDAEARALLNLAEIAIDWRDADRADADTDLAIRFCTRQDMEPYALCAMGTRLMLRLWRGAWAEAADDAAFVLHHPHTPAINRILPLTVLGLLRARRGDPGAWEMLDAAHRLPAPTGEHHRVVPLAAARAEAAWLDGDPTRAASEARSAYALALERGSPWMVGELALWLHRACALDAPPDNAAEPYARHLAGEPAKAAEIWARIGFPFERALALADCEDEESAREALRILLELGATRVAAVVAAGLRDRGIRRLPRGPRSATREHPDGLTRRQRDVLALLTQGLSNQRIADRLHISPRTVEHHVSAILTKLEAGSRTEAALRGAELNRT